MHTTLYVNLHCLDITIITAGLCQFSLPVSVMYRILLLFPVCICSVHFEDQDHLSVRFQIHSLSLLSQICTTDQDVLQKASIKGGGGGEREREKEGERERERKEIWQYTPDCTACELAYSAIFNNQHGFILLVPSPCCHLQMEISTKDVLCY